MSRIYEKHPNFWFYSVCASTFWLCYVVAVFASQKSLNKSVSRRLSRMTGRLMNLPLPPYFRALLYRAFGWAYGVKFDEIKEGDVNNFKTFN